MTDGNARRAVDDAIMDACAEALGIMHGDGGPVVTRYALVVEYAATNRGKGLARISGPEGTTTWEAAGLWHEALYGDWPDPDPDDEGDKGGDG